MKVARYLLILMVIFSFSVQSYAQLSGAYTIDPKGTTSRNYKSFKAAVNALESNGVSSAVSFTIASGLYVERVRIKAINGASAANIIVFDGGHQDSVTVTFSATSGNERATWHLDGVDHLVVKNITIEATGAYRSSIHFANEANYNSIENCALVAKGSSVNYRNIVFASNSWKGGSHGDYNSMKNCLVEGGYYGIYMNGAGFLGGQHNDHNYFENLILKGVHQFGVYSNYSDSCVFFHCDLSPDYAFGYGIYNNYAYHNTYNSCTVTGSGYGVYDNHARYNKVESCKFSGQRTHNIYNYQSDHQEYINNELRTPDYYNFYSFGATDINLIGNQLEGGKKYTYYNMYISNGKDDSIVGNKVNKALYYNMYLFDCEQSLVANNMVFGELPGASNDESNCYLLSCKDLKVYHNTFYNSGGGGTNYGSVAYYLPSNVMNYYSTGTDLRNNIFEYTGNFSGGVNVANYLGTFQALDHNNHVSTQETAIENTTSFLSLDIWKKSNRSYNSGSTNEVNRFLDLPNGDLHLSSKYPGISGAELGVLEDIDGDVRCQYAQTVGADESEFVVDKPHVGFSVDDTVYLNSPFLALNKNVGNIGMRHFWFVNGVLEDSTEHFEYTFTKKGHSSIKLVTVNCGGFDDTILQVFVDSSTIAPAADFVVDRNEVDVYEEIEVYDLSRFGPTSWKWTVSPDSIYDPALLAKVPTHSFVSSLGSASNNPSISFFYPGYYSVGLVAENASGKDSLVKSNVILVRASNSMCVYPGVAKTPSGTLYDDGGQNNDYSNNLNCGFLIDPCAKEVTLTLKSLDLENGYDFIRIYDGTDTLGTPLWNMSAYGNRGITGNTLSSGFDSVFVAKSGKMYIQATTDNGNVGDGFVAAWTSKSTSFSAPKAGFSSPDSVCVGHPIAFDNTSSGDVKEFLWDFDVNTFSISQAKSPDYIFTEAGTYRVRLEAQGCAGTDIATKDIVAYYINRIPEGDFEADITRPAVDDIVSFFPETKFCVDTFKWVIKPASGFKYVNYTSDSSETPQIKFTHSGTYSIELVLINRATSDTVRKKDYIEVIGYCTPVAGALSADIGISGVYLNGTPALNYSSASGNKAYSDFTTQFSYLEQDGLYEMKISRPSTYNKVIRVAWIDWDQDGFFESNEKVIEERSTGSYKVSFSDTFRVPLSAAIGGTRMRVLATLAGASIDPCSAQTGEYEDYRVYVSKDQTAPVIELNGPDTVYIEQCVPYVDSGAVVCDNIDGCGLKYSIQGTVSTLAPDTHDLMFTALDKAGNKAAPVQRTVVVFADQTAPEIELIGSDTLYLEVFDTYTEPNALASDACGTPTVTILPKVDTAVLGTYQVVYEANDGVNGSVKLRTVIVEDTQSPLLALKGYDTVYHEVHTAFTDSGVTTSDNYYKVTSGGLWTNVTGLLDIHTKGTYSLFYQSEDASGNKSVTLERTIIVQDTTVPAIQLLGPDTMSLEVFDRFLDPLAKAFDNHDGDLGLPSLKGNFYSFFEDAIPDSIGEFVAEYHFTDAEGNDTFVERIILVVDTESPEITLFGSETMTLCRWSSFEDPGSDADDNYDKDLQVNLDESTLNTGVEGFYYVTYSCVDQSGNSSKKRRYVQVVHCNTGIDGAQMDVSLYPNPTSGLVFVSIEGSIEGQMEATLMSTEGRVIQQWSISQGNTETRVDLSSQTSGIYLLRIEGEYGVLIKKITLSR